MRLIGKILLAALAYIVGMVVTGILIKALNVPPMQMPEGMTPRDAFLGFALATPLLAAGMIPVAWGLGGGRAKRRLSLALLMFVAIGVNTALEGSIFSTIMKGHAVYLAMQSFVPCLLAAVVLAGLRTGSYDAPPFTCFGALGSAWRLLVAWLSFPVIYWSFGSIVAPLVMDYYKSGVAGLQIPDTGTIIRMQLLRGALFLVASLPIVVLWKKSRAAFILGVGLAYAVTVGIFQLAQATFMPEDLRIIHSIEITADSFAYAAVLAFLFVRRTPQVSNDMQKQRAASV